MGLTTLKMQVAHPDRPEKTEELEFLIDSGAIYSVVPAPFCGGCEFDHSPLMTSVSLMAVTFSAAGGEPCSNMAPTLASPM